MVYVSKTFQRASFAIFCNISEKDGSDQIKSKKTNDEFPKNGNNISTNSWKKLNEAKKAPSKG